MRGRTLVVAFGQESCPEGRLYSAQNMHGRGDIVDHSPLGLHVLRQVGNLLMRDSTCLEQLITEASQHFIAREVFSAVLRQRSPIGLSPWLEPGVVHQPPLFHDQLEQVLRRVDRAARLYLEI